MILMDVLMLHQENGLKIIKKENLGIIWEDLNMANDSVKIILNQHKQEHITEDEAVQLIKDIYNTKIVYPYIYPWSLTAVTYDTEFPKYEITCKTK